MKNDHYYLLDAIVKSDIRCRVTSSNLRYSICSSLKDELKLLGYTTKNVKQFYNDDDNSDENDDSVNSLVVLEDDNPPMIIAVEATSCIILFFNDKRQNIFFGPVC